MQGGVGLTAKHAVPPQAPRNGRLTCTAEPQTAVSSPYPSKSYDIFISHRGPKSKWDVAIPLREELQARRLTAFVDETDLRPTGDAARNMEQAIRYCKVCTGTVYGILLCTAVL